MDSSLKRLIGWATPLPPGFDRPTLAARLGHDRGSCLAHRQGLCPGPDLCADCPWAEGVSRKPANRL